jgi:hypothetical protein
MPAAEKERHSVRVLGQSNMARVHMMAQVLPLVQERAVVLNWSERKKWPNGRWWLMFSARLLGNASLIHCSSYFAAAPCQSFSLLVSL